MHISSFFDYLGDDLISTYLTGSFAGMVCFVFFSSFEGFVFRTGSCVVNLDGGLLL